jgi:hypothetical protein
MTNVIRGAIYAGEEKNRIVVIVKIRENIKCCA